MAGRYSRAKRPSRCGRGFAGRCEIAGQLGGYRLKFSGLLKNSSGIHCSPWKPVLFSCQISIRRTVGGIAALEVQPGLNKLGMMNRREFGKLWLLSLVGIAAAWRSWTPVARASELDVEKHIAALTNNRKLEQGRVAIELPQISRSAKSVPFTVRVDSPMTSSDYVKSIHLFAAENDLPKVASFFLSPKGGKAEVSSRMRLKKSQAVIAVAEMNDGTWFIGRRTIEIARPGFTGTR